MALEWYNLKIFMGDQKEKLGGSESTQEGANASADALILALKQGVRPTPEKTAELMRLLSSPQTPQLQQPDIVHAIAAVLSQPEANNDLAGRVAVVINEVLTSQKNMIWSRECAAILAAHNVRQNVEAGKIIRASLLESLRNNEPLPVIAKKTNLLHDFPDEVGGGGFTGMRQDNELRKALLSRLLIELKQSGATYTDRSIPYLLERTCCVNLSDAQCDRFGIDSRLTGNARSVAIV